MSSVSFKIIGQSGNIVDVTTCGELVVSPIRPDQVSFNELSEPDIAYNFYKPEQGRSFLVTGITAKADKQVSSINDATVVVYEASDATTTTVNKVIYQDVMVEGDRIMIFGLNLFVSRGAFINAKTTDDDIHMNILGRYIDA